MGAEYKYQVDLCYILNLTKFLLFIDGVLKEPGVDYIINPVSTKYCGGCVTELIFKEELTSEQHLCIIIDGDDFWLRVDEKTNKLVDESKDRPGNLERMIKWL